VKPSDTSKSNSRGRVFAWLQLMRLPNVFTAVADVAMGFLVTHRDLQPAQYFAMLTIASCLLYLSGMVLNDVFDAEVDAREQPNRPIPSGRISLRAATAVGWAMLPSGVLVAWFASFAARDWRPGVIVTILAACVVSYDRILKRTPVAPLVMGACRALNVLLGMSLAPLAAEAAAPTVEWGSVAAWLLAIGVGIYVVGVTVFSGTDARTSSRGRLALITLRRCVSAIVDPSPQRVQTAVRHCVQTIIVLDAAVCVGYASPYWGFAVLALIFPTVVLAGWLRAT
jgi:4-hydroxybenzoate polyprenyltransferase